MTKYRVEINMIEQGYVDIECEDKADIDELAVEECDRGGFRSFNSTSEIVKIIDLTNE